jgi:hypothetical protein
MSLELKQQTCASQAVDPRTSQTMLISLVGFHPNASSKMSAKFE